jgi:hypothetical protein
VAVLAAADLAADGHRASIRGAIDERYIRPFFGTDTALEPLLEAIYGATTAGAGGVREGELAVDIGLWLAGDIIRTRSSNLGSSTVLAFMATTAAGVADHFSECTSTIIQ